MVVSIPLGGIYNEEKQAEQRNTVYSLRRKKNSGKCNGVISAQGDEWFKSKPDTKWNKGVVTSGQDPSLISSQHMKQRKA